MRDQILLLISFILCIALIVIFALHIADTQNTFCRISENCTTLWRSNIYPSFNGIFKYG